MKNKMENYILYIQFECDDEVRKEVEEIIDFYAGGIDNSTLRKADKYPLFKDTYLIYFFYKYPSVDDFIRDISDKLQRVLWDGKGKYLIINIPRNKDERNKLINGWISVNAVEWLNKHATDDIAEKRETDDDNLEEDLK